MKPWLCKTAVEKDVLLKCSERIKKQSACEKNHSTANIVQNKSFVINGRKDTRLIVTDSNVGHVGSYLLLILLSLRGFELVKNFVKGRAYLCGNGTFPLVKGLVAKQLHV